MEFSKRETKTGDSSKSLQRRGKHTTLPGLGSRESAAVVGSLPAGSETGPLKPFPFPYYQEDGLGGVPNAFLTVL